VQEVAFSPVDNSLASCASDDRVLIWSATDWSSTCLGPTRYPMSIAFHPDGSRLACAHLNGVTIWDLARPFEQRGPNASATRRVRFTPEGQLATNAEFAPLWAPEEFRLVPLLAQPYTNFFPVTTFALSSDGTMLAASRQTGYRFRPFVEILAATSGTSLTQLRDIDTAASNLAFSPDGRFLAATTAAYLWVWNVATWKVLAQIPPDARFFHAIAFTPDGRFLAAVNTDRTVRFYDTSTWRQHIAFDWDIGPLLSLDISRDGLRAAAGSKTGKIVVWDLDF